MDEKLRVLVVEDDPSLRKVLELRLGLEGFAVTSAPDGRAALDVLEEARPEVVVCDLMMPRLDGFGFCRAVRAQPHHHDLPVIILTARSRDADIEELITLGGIVFMSKPFDAPALASTLRTLARNGGC